MWQCVSIKEVSCNRIRLDGTLPDSASLCFKRGHSRSFYSLAASPSSPPFPLYPPSAISPHLALKFD